MGIIGRIATAAAAAIGMRFALNAMLVINGEGIVERTLGYPLSAWWLWAIVGAIIGVGTTVIRKVRGRARGEALSEWAAQNRFEYRDRVGQFEFQDLLGLDAFNDWHAANDHLIGKVNENDVEMVDFTSIHESSEERTKLHDQTIIVFRRGASQLPDFELRPRTMSLRLMRFAGAGSLEICTDAQAGPQLVETITQFNKQYMLFPGGLGDLMQGILGESDADSYDVEPLRSIFTATVLQLLNRHPGWCIESQADHLAFWKPKCIVPARERQQVLDTVDRLRDALAGARQDGPTKGLVWQFSPPGNPAAQTNLVSLVTGAFVGFFVGGVTGMFLFFQIETFPLMFIGFFGPPFLGAALGGLVGFQIGNRLR